LKNISPIALIRQQTIALIIFEFDGKLIPWAAGVTMAATKGDG